MPKHLLSAALSSAAVLLIVAAASAQSTANIAIDTTRAIRTVDARTFGLNTAVWDSRLNSTQTMSLLGAAQTKALRFPGGSTSDTYHWQTNRSDGNTFTWASNVDAFANIAVPLNAQVFITINYGSGTVQEAADWVRYTNITKNYGFKYWEIGNENYGSWENDTHSPKWDPYTYAKTAEACITAMKAVDPTIKIGVVVVTGEDSFTNNHLHPATNPRTGAVHNGWTPVLLATLQADGVIPDFIIYHRYDQAPGQESDANLLQSSRTWRNDAANLRQQLNDYLGGQAAAAVEIDVTENNSVYSNTGKQTTSLVNGLFMADSIGNLLQTEFNSLIWWDLRNGPDYNNNNSPSLFGWRKYGDYGVVSDQGGPYPTYYIHKLLSHFARGGEQVVSAASDNPLLAAYAVQDSNGVRLLAINKDPSATNNANITVNGFTPGGAATAFWYGIPQDRAAKTMQGSPDADATETQVSNAGPSFTYPFPPYSVTVISLTAGTAPQGPMISSADFAPPKFLTINGSGFGSSPRVLVNGADVSDTIRSASDTVIRIKAKAKVLGLVTGSNAVQVISGGMTSNTFNLTL
jgi:hypothetical protein